jgi:hypothetical protein
LIAKGEQYSRVVTLFGVQLKAEVAFDGVIARRLVVYTKCFVSLQGRSIQSSMVASVQRFLYLDITVEVRGRVGLLELLVGDVFSSVNFFLHFLLL